MKKSMLISLLLKAALLVTVSDAFSTLHKPQRTANALVFPRVAHREIPTLTATNSPLFQPRRPTLLASTAEEGSQEEAVDVGKPKAGLGKRIASYFKGSDADDGLTFRQRLAKMGLATVLSYGWISNTNAMVLVSAAWYAFCAKTGMSPLYPGQWKNFLGVYAGFYMFSNLLRPARVTIAVAIGPYFDRIINWVQRKTRLPKAAAVTCTVLLVNLGGTLLLMVGGISAASLLSGVPVFPPKA